jgi:hypothetical protein
MRVIEFLENNENVIKFFNATFNTIKSAYSKPQ